MLGMGSGSHSEPRLKETPGRSHLEGPCPSGLGEGAERSLTLCGGESPDPVEPQGLVKTRSVLELRKGTRQPVVLRAKPGALFSRGTWGASQLEVRQQTQSFTDFRAASLTGPGQRV